MPAAWTKGRFTLLLGAWVLGAIGCGGQESDIAAAGTHIAGTVRDGAGAPVTGAQVQLTAHRDGIELVTATVTSDPAGAFSRDLYVGLAPPGPAQLAVQVTPPDGSPLTPRAMDSIPVTFSTGSVPEDSTTIDVVLDP